MMKGIIRFAVQLNHAINRINYRGNFKMKIIRSVHRLYFSHLVKSPFIRLIIKILINNAPPSFLIYTCHLLRIGETIPINSVIAGMP